MGTSASLVLCSIILEMAFGNPVHFPENLICGILPSSTREGRIIGGREAIPGEIPWVVSIQNKRTHFCGGSIISNRFILSAAHCFSHLDSDAELSVVLGGHRILNNEKDGNNDNGHGHLTQFERVGIKSVKIHPEFDGGLQFLNDIAVMELATNVEWTPFLLPVCLPNHGEEFGRTADRERNISGIASGWGRTWGQKEPLDRNDLDFEDEYKVHSDVLKLLNLTILPNSECDEYYKKSWNPVTLDSTQMCAGAADKDWEEDTALGDSGGPLQIQQNGRWTIAGITSYGKKFKAPGVYCRVSSYLNFIKEVTSGK